MTADPIGGVWTYACELINALADQGVEVVLATMGASLNAVQQRMVRELPNVTLAESNFALEWMPNPWHDVDAAGDWLRTLVQRHSPDVMHVNGYAHAALDVGVPVVCVAHSCVATWMRAVRGTDLPPLWAEYRARVTGGLRAADAVVAPTSAILSAILAAYGVERAGRVIPNGRSSSTFRPVDKEPFVLAAGRLWDEAKGIGDLDTCSIALRWPIRVAGPLLGPRGSGQLRPREISALGELSPDELAGWMARASIFALPARYEPFGLTALEAALAGCTLVLGDIPTLREIWGADAMFVPPGDPPQLAFALESLIRDPLRRGALAACARTRALSLTPRRMAGAYRELYDEVIAAAPRQEVCA